MAILEGSLERSDTPIYKWINLRILARKCFSTKLSAAPSLDPCANQMDFWESPGKSVTLRGGGGHSPCSQEWEITVTPLIWPELPTDKVGNSARHSNFLGLCSDNHSFHLRPIKKNTNHEAFLSSGLFGISLLFSLSPGSFLILLLSSCEPC